MSVCSDHRDLAPDLTHILAYQSYIDLVATHSRTVQAAFLQAYSAIAEAPDPYPLLEASVESLVIAEETVPRLEAENVHLQSTTARLTDQLAATESRLEEQRSARAAAEAATAVKVKEVTESWSVVLEEKQTNWQAREKSLEERAEHQDRLLKELKASYETTQRLERSEAEDGDNFYATASAAELDVANAELERTSMRLAEVESRNERLQIELAQTRSQAGTLTTSVSIEDDPAVLHLRSENSSLLRRLETSRFEKDSATRRWDGEARNLKREVAALKEAQDRMRAKLAGWQDYDDIKRELDVLKSIEFSAGDGEDVGDGAAQATAGALSEVSAALNLEQLLLARNKKLNDEVTVLRVSHQEVSSRSAALQAELGSANLDLERSRKLTATLENDLARMQDNTYPPAAASVAGTYTSRYQPSSYGRRGRVSPTSSIISGFDSSYSSPTTLEALRNGEASGGGSGILPMVTAQRDRFKKRNNELELELAKTQQNVTTLRSEMATLQKDNVNLYERTRYVSTYSRNQPASSSTSLATNPNPSSIQISDDDGPLGKYKSEYEAKISPFAAFRGRESSRAFRRMTLPERMVFRATRLVLSTRTSRNFFALYVLVMHVILFLVFIPSGMDVHQTVHAASEAAAAQAAALPEAGGFVGG